MYRYPPGVFNVVNGLGQIVGDALSRHMDIDKVSLSSLSCVVDGH
jgi:acyl-CoA reductase-like NAD-dependent aldehyde dehydrogenase